MAPFLVPEKIILFLYFRCISMSGYLLPIGELSQPQPSIGPSQSVKSQSARILLSNGLQVTCESNSALSGTYPADNSSVTMLLGVQNFIDRNARFPGGTGEYVVADITGNPHVFTTAIVSGGNSPPSFTQLVYALADFSALCNAVAITGIGAVPSATTTIA
jgi:hypothetical protein